MDGAKDLVSELEHKLGELNQKVAAYQREMLAEFEKHMQERLSDLPGHVAAQVSQAISESMSNYPALRNHQDSSPPTPTVLADRALWDGRRSPPPILYHTSGTPKEGHRSPHEREEEFHGLFTPSYLPLLDSSERAMQSPPTPPGPASPSLHPPQDPVELAALLPNAPARDPPQATRPTPIRRLTDRSCSSVESSGSEARTRRSALRRTSSSTKGSPRRVRFEFQGVEVLPDSSPQASTILGQPSEAEEQPDTSAIIEEDESPSYSGTSLLDVDGEEDALPRPKKVSSTQALRALSQQPLDAGTVWTVVNAEPEQSHLTKGKEEWLVQSQPFHPSKPTPTGTTMPGSAEGACEEMPQRPQVVEQLGSPIEDMAPHEDNDASDEGDFLSIISKKSKSQLLMATSPKTPPLNKKPPVPRATQSSHTESDKNVPRTSSLTPKTPGIDEDEPMFEFEEDGMRLKQPTSQRLQKYIKEDEAETSISDTNHSSAPTTATVAGSLPVRRPPTSLPMLAQSVGSYNGAPLNFAPITNSDLYQEIASMKDIHLFVGSVDGRSGADAADLDYYRASLAELSGVPKSFSERLAFEELAERKKVEEAEKTGQRSPAQE